MAFKLVCTVPMHGIRKGDAITDQATVERLLASHDHHFVKVAMTDEPAPASAPEKPAK